MKRYWFTIWMMVTNILTPVGMGMISVTEQRISHQGGTVAYLNKEVRHELITLPYYTVFDWLQFEVKTDDSVVLMGQVTKPTLKSDAENVVKRIEGVTHVVNQIEVLPLSGDDDRLRRAVYRAIFSPNSPLTRYSLGAVPPIHIIVNHGNVTLKGVVDNQGDSNIANIKANGVSGVFSVKNELVILGDGGKPASSSPATAVKGSRS